MKICFIITLLLLALLWQGCPFHADYPLTDTKQCKEDKRLLGRWRNTTKNGQIKELFIQSTYKHNAMGISTRQDENAAAIRMYYPEVYATTLGNFNILMLYRNDTADAQLNGYYYFNYWFEKYQLNLQEIHLPDTTLNSINDVQQHFRNHLLDSGSLSEKQVFVRY